MARVPAKSVYIVSLIDLRNRGAYNDGLMSGRTEKRRSALAGGFFHLEEEGTKTRVSGFGYDNHIKLKDEYGNVWLGTAERGNDNTVVYRFRDSKGRSLTGVSEHSVVTLRDEKGRTWKGFID